MEESGWRAGLGLDEGLEGNKPWEFVFGFE